MDVDWVTDPILEDSISLLDAHDVEATLFSTHADGIDASAHERAVHPNFLGDDDRTEREILDELTATYPDATGIRSHCLYTHSRLQQRYPEYGFAYESNYLMYGCDGITPFEMNDGIVQFPIRFMDDVALRRDDEVDAATILSGDGLRVLAFHPIHVYLNTPTIDYYERHKSAYQDPEALRKRRHNGPGVRRLFKNVISTVSETATLGSLIQRYNKET